jgi:hypothetical protein
MSMKPVWWTLLAVMALAAILLLNYWASYQPLSTLAYSGWLRQNRQNTQNLPASITVRGRAE